MFSGRVKKTSQGGSKSRMKRRAEVVYFLRLELSDDNGLLTQTIGAYTSKQSKLLYKEKEEN